MGAFFLPFKTDVFSSGQAVSTGDAIEENAPRRTFWDVQRRHDADLWSIDLCSANVKPAFLVLFKVVGAKLAAAVAERDRASSAVSALQRQVAEQEREVAGLRAELKEAKEAAAAADAATEASRKVCVCVCVCVCVPGMSWLVVVG